MPAIGETLREARMRQGLDVADVEQRTKIRAKYLRALENEEWALLPGPTFVKTFLRTYAEVVGLDPHVLVEEFRHSHEQPEESEFQPLAPRPRRDAPRGRRRQSSGALRGSRRLLAAGAIAALLAFLLALGLLGGEDDPDDRDDGVAATQTETDAATTAEPPASERDRTRRRPRQAPRGVDVRVVPAEPTYACVDNGPGTEAREVTLEAPRRFRHPRLVRLNLGKRSVEVTLNGDPVPVAESSDALGLALRPGGSSEIPLGERPCA